MYEVKQKATPYFNDDPFIKVEKAGRTCYQSSMSDDYEKSKKFIQSALKNKHYSIFEHLVFVYIFPKACDGNFYHLKKALDTAETCPNFYTSVNEEENRSIISINFRFLMEAYYGNDVLKGNKLLYPLVEAIYRKYPELFLDEIVNETNENNELELAKCLTGDEFISLYLSSLNEEEKLKHVNLSFLLWTDRGVMAELTRHRLNSFSISSTRYINFQKKLDGIPVVAQVEPLPKRATNALKGVADTYKKMVEDGVKPEIARGVLPNILWTEIFTTANLMQWKHVLDLRTNNAAHPQIRELALMIRKEIDSVLGNK